MCSNFESSSTDFFFFCYWTFLFMLCALQVLCPGQIAFTRALGTFLPVWLPVWAGVKAANCHQVCTDRAAAGNQTVNRLGCQQAKTKKKKSPSCSGTGTITRLCVGACVGPILRIILCCCGESIICLIVFAASGRCQQCRTAWLADTPTHPASICFCCNCCW